MRKQSLLATAFILAVTSAQPAVAETAASVPVRAGTHETFDRVVFDWPRHVKYHFTRHGDRAEITFDAAGDMQFEDDVAQKLTRARGFSAQTDEAGHVTVSFAVNPKASVHAFTSSSSVVIDIAGKNAPETAITPVTAPVPAKTPAAAPQLSPPAIQAAAAAADKATPAPAADPSPPAVVATPVAATPVPPAPPPAVTPAAASVAAPVAPAIAVPTLAGDPPKPPAPPEIKKPVEDPATVIPPPRKSSVQLAIALTDTPALVATLDPHIAARAVIFIRSGYGYIIFERKLTLSADDLANGKKMGIDMQPIDMPKNSGFRFALPPGTEISATRDGTAWKIFLSRHHADMPVSTTLIAQPDFALGARFLLPLPDAPDPIHLVDPIVGDDLILIPLAQSEAFNIARQMSDFDILPAAQGLIIKPLTDKVIVRAVSDGIEITADGGLQLSPATDTGSSQQSASKARAAQAGKSIFDFATWKGKPDETFTQTRQRLQQTIVDVPETERNRARLELARFYFANGDGEEAVGLLNYLAQLVPDLRVHADFVALMGASEILAYRADDGLHELSSPLFTEQPEIEMWQAVGLAEERNWQEAEEKFSVTETMLAGYPEPFFSRFMVLAIESALAMNKEHEAADWLNFVTAAPHNEGIDPALNYLRGALHAKAGRASSAEDAWKSVEASRDRLYKVRAELALIDLGVSTGSLTPAQAADRLEALRFGWRGDDLEVDILHRLGQFYIDAKNVKAGLNALAQAVALYPESPLAPQIHTEMSKAFHDVFLGELGKKLSPLDSLTLYQQYRDLMPTGKEGDQVMRNLSERLVSIDLLDQAGSLLDDLARNRLQGAEKSTVALRLAGIRLLDHQPADALDALTLVAPADLNPTQQNDRVLLQARALSELHRAAEATALLKDNNSQGARMLRADIAMHAQAWPEAAKALMELVGPPPQNGKTLTSQQSTWLINAAIAYALDSDQAGLDQLAIDYSAAMASMPQNDTFRMLTQPEKEGQMRDLAAAQSQISQVDMFQDFLNSYRAPSGDASPPQKK
ncbi:MAG: hypothetical protein P4M15_08135 [Alphaproteobacteria bacterium]|nr:hypothetical protein [Alphaproteobacteria bacterium]